jgi:glycosyltransferase involved in cell wall biosynthesis
MKLKVCILLPWDINNDSRAQRTALTLSEAYEVHIYHVSNKENKPKLLKSILVKNISPFSRSWKDRFFLPFHSSSKALKYRVKEHINSYDIFYCHDLPALYALKDYNLKDKKIVYDIHDLYVETINQGVAPIGSPITTRLKSKIAVFLFRYFIKKNEKKLIQRTQLNFSTNHSFSGYIENLYGVKCEIIENLPVNRPFPEEKLLRKTLDLPSNKRIVLYHGNLGGGRFLSEIVSSAEFFNDNICLVVMGKGQLLCSLKSIASANVYFLDSVPYNLLFEYVSDADLGIVILEHINFSKKHASANKLYEYMACAVPVLVSNSPELVKVVNQVNNGAVIDSVTPQEIANSINALFKNPKQLKEQGENGRNAYVEYYNWKTQEQKLLNLFKFENKAK